MQPRFKVGDNVIMKNPTLYKETEGVITDVEKVFKDLDKYYLEQGKEVFEEDGLAHRESDIPSIQIPFTFDGTYLVIDYGKSLHGSIGKKTAKFSGFCYTIKTAQMNTIYAERQLILKK